MNTKTANFSKQNKREKTSRLTQLVKENSDIVLWIKGDKKREKFKAKKFIKDKLLLVVHSTKQTDLLDKNVLYTFTVNGVNYFGSSSLKSLGSELYSIDCNLEMYKSERRDSYRLLTYPHQEVFCYLPTTQDELSPSKVVDMRIGMSQTNLFKNFLKIVGEEEESLVHKGFTKYRVLDVSVSGLSIKIGELERKHFTIGKQVEPVILYFKKEEIVIPQSDVRHIVPIVMDSRKNYKVGLQFKEVDTNMDELLGKLINEALRDYDSEFEDFV